MLRKMTIAGAIVAVAGLGLGGVALAQSATAPAAPAAASLHAESAASSTASSTAPTTGADTARHGQKHMNGIGKGHSLLKRLGKVSHAQWVSKDKNGTFVTHDAVRGSVSAVSTTSITVKATDGTTETFSVNADTKIHKGAKGTPGAISTVKPGDEVGVLGTGTAPMVATHILDRGTGHGQKAPAPKTTAPTTS